MLIRAPLAARRNDLYQTPPQATEALLRVEKLPHCIWECACGPGAIVRVLRGGGHHVVATDLINYGTAEQDHAGWDFLLEHKRPAGVEMIVTNPPFKLATEFVAHALSLCPRVIMLLRLTFLESTSRASILDNGHLARVHVFKKQIADDAPRRLGRAEGFESDSLRLVCLGR